MNETLTFTTCSQIQMTNKKKSILKRRIKLFIENFYKRSFEDLDYYLGRIFRSIVLLIVHI